MVEVFNEIIEIGGIMVYIDFVMLDYLVGWMFEVIDVLVWYVVIDDFGDCVGF